METPLSTNVAAGDPNHASLHNAERARINKNHRRRSISWGQFPAGSLTGTESVYSRTLKGTGTLTGGTGGLTFNRGTVAADGVSLRSPGYGSKAFFDRSPSISASVFVNAASAGSSWDFYVASNRLGTISSLSLTQKHIGFIVRNTAGTITIHATVANGTTQTVSAALPYSGDFATYPRTIEARLEDGAVTIYLDGTSIGSVSTNLPSGDRNNEAWSMTMMGVSGTNNDSMIVTDIEVAQAA